MEINLNSTGFGAIGASRESLDAQPLDAGRVAKDAGQVARSKSAGGAVSSTFDLRSSTFDALQSSEPVADVPDEALSRDDELGKLVGAAFNLPAPPMPSFIE